MAMLLFGIMGVSSLFSLFAFGGLAFRAIRLGGWLYDKYFWITAGISIISAGLLWFASLRTYQAMVLHITPYVQHPIGALTGVAIITAGLACLMRAQSLSRPHIGRLFIYACVGWLFVTFLWSVL